MKWKQFVNFFFKVRDLTTHPRSQRLRGAKFLMKIILILLLCIFYSSCEEYDYRLNIYNNTQKELFFTISQETNYYDNSFKMPALKNDNPEDYCTFLMPGDSIRLQNFGKKSWNNYVNNSSSKSLHLFYFSKNSIKNNSWNKIYNNRLYFKHKEYKISDLEKTGWVIMVNP
jgi:hypothetical protein